MNIIRNILIVNIHSCENCSFQSCVMCGVDLCRVLGVNMQCCVSIVAKNAGNQNIRVSRVLMTITE